jgi:hypothetical protein
MPLLALNGQSDRTCVCPLLDNNGQRRILARHGLSANDPERTCNSDQSMSESRRDTGAWWMSGSGHDRTCRLGDQRVWW